MDKGLSSIMHVIRYRARSSPRDLDIKLQRAVINEMSKRWLAMAIAPWYIFFKPKRGIV